MSAVKTLIRWLCGGWLSRQPGDVPPHDEAVRRAVQDNGGQDNGGQSDFRSLDERRDT
jgi:hypothetical protein